MKHLSLIPCWAILMFATISCGSDEPSFHDDPGDSSPIRNYETYKTLYHTLFDTSWSLIDSYELYDNGEKKRSNSLESYKYETISFSSQSRQDLKNEYLKFYCSKFNGCGFWYIQDDGELLFSMNNNSLISSFERGLFSGIFGRGGKVEFVGTSAIRTECKYSNHTAVRLFNKTSYTSPDDSSDSDQTESGYEKPEVDYYDCTPIGSTGLKIEYHIPNKSKAGVTSAQIYYGTSSPTKSASTNIIGEFAIANITGLNKNTTYYIKCVVKSKGGTTTSTTTKVSTF